MTERLLGKRKGPTPERQPAPERQPVNLAEAEAELRRTLPPGVGRFRLSDIAQLANLKTKNQPRATLYRLLDAELASPVADDSNTRSSRIYDLEGAIKLLLACRVIEQEDCKPRAAAIKVRKYWKGEGRFAGRQLMEIVLNVAFMRFELHILGRLAGALLSTVCGDFECPPGTIVFFDKVRETDPKKMDMEAARLHADALLQSPRPRSVGVVGEAHEIVFVDALASNVLDNRQLRVVFASKEKAGALILVAEPVDENAPLPPKPRQLESQRESLTMRLAHAIGAGYDEFRLRVLKSLPFDLKGIDHRTPNQNDLLLWLLARFACVVAGPDCRDLRCAIMMPQLDQTEYTVLKVLAASDRHPWEEDKRQTVLRLGQLLSGYASLTGVSLTVPSTTYPYDQLVSQHAFEQAHGSEGALTCIAVPISTRSGGPSPVLYVWMPPLDTDLNNLVKALQVFAPIVGELVQRRFDTVHTLKSSADAGLSQYLKRDYLSGAIARQIERLRREPGMKLLRRDGDQRLALVTLSATPGDSEWAHIGGKWLAEQLPYLVPRVLLNPWFSRGVRPEGMGRPVFGELGPNSILIMIPRPLQKKELDELRAALPTRLNEYEPAFGETGRTMARLNAWVVDEKWAEIATGPIAADVANALVARASAAVDLMEDIIHAYQEGIVRGDWSQALRSAKAGLARDPSNTYLLRRASEFSACGGDFLAAESYARTAAMGRDAPVLARCLLGDALLGQARVREAIKEYDQAQRHEPNHPLSSYHKGFALLTIGRLLEETATEKAWGVALGTEIAESAPMRSKLTRIREHIAKICLQAAEPLRKSQASLQHLGTPGLHRFQNFYQSSAAFGLCLAELVKGNVAGEIQELTAARTAKHRDDLIVRELLTARMRQARIGEVLFERYCDSDLDFI